MVLKGVPDVTYFSFKASTRWNSQASGRATFCRTTVEVWVTLDLKATPAPSAGLVRILKGSAEALQISILCWTSTRLLDQISTIQSPIQGGFTLAAGGREELSSSIPLIGGGLLGLNTSVFYNRDASYYDDGINDRWSREGLDAGMAPADTQQTAPEEFLTRVYDVTRAQSVGELGRVCVPDLGAGQHGCCSELSLHPRREDTAVLATNTRGRDFYLDPAFHDVDGDGSPDFPGGVDANPDVSPYVRSEALTYNERKHHRPCNCW